MSAYVARDFPKNNISLDDLNESIKSLAITKSRESKEAKFAKNYEEALNICFSEKPQLIKFDSNSTDEDIDRFFDSL